MSYSFLNFVQTPESVVTAIDSSPTFPEFIRGRLTRYQPYVEIFHTLINTSSSSAELLHRIRDPREYNAEVRMALLKLFRRCVSTVIDTEKSKKLSNPTEMFVEHYGHTFKPIELLQSQFQSLSYADLCSLTSLIGEYDDRGKQGYILTDTFFSWFENNFGSTFSIEGPRGAGKDIQLRAIFPDFTSDYPCDFVIKHKLTNRLVCVGFARYDSTRGGSQSDDRTGGNNDKVSKAVEYSRKTGTNFKILFVSDGPGLTHKDTWYEACLLDGAAGDLVRVSTLKLLGERVTYEWLMS